MQKHSGKQIYCSIAEVSVNGTTTDVPEFFSVPRRVLQYLHLTFHHFPFSAWGHLYFKTPDQPALSSSLFASTLIFYLSFKTLQRQ